PEDYRHALEAVAALAGRIGQRPVLDVGGGFGLGLELAPLAALAWEAARAFGATLWTEPGRWLVARAGVLLTSVLEVKRTGRPYVVCDAGMTELIRPMLYGAEHPVLPLSGGAGGEAWDLAGPACESGDVLARDVPLGQPERGDLLAVLEAGAYGASMASNYLTRPRPAEVLLLDGEWRQVRRRDTLAEMLAAETA
ncbi:MAG TPA: diaminopimelate decarboxylase, partial [Deinococcales bacterium]|nr:diaminopimelate decarboxylase [Deinococcales bacterium]